MNQLDEILAALQGLPEKEREELVEQAVAATSDMSWLPNPGPQTEAFYCEADELFYGGQAGGGKSALGVGLAVTDHQRSLILRRINKDAKKLAIAELIGNIRGGDRSGWNGTDLCLREGDRVIEFGGCELEDDKQRYKGDPHDLIVFDEVTDFLESQYVFITIWNRSTKPGQRCRIVATGNPPTNANGLWVIKRWGPWLDPKHPNPAKPGELRWFIRDENDQDKEVEGPGEYEVEGHIVEATSRTFIPAKLSDNPDLDADGEYGRKLSSLPKELRDAYRDGKFDASLKDQPFQVIPTEWVVAAQARWTPDGYKDLNMTAMGLDPAGGGGDSAVLAYRHGGWYGELQAMQGVDTKSGSKTCALVVAARRHGAPVITDVGGGYAGATIERFQDNRIDYVSFDGGKASTAKTRDGSLSFVNKRAEAWWKFREELDPEQEGGSVIALPPDPELLADLTSPTYEIKTKGIVLEAKEEIRKRIGRSPDRGDAVVMALSEGNKAMARVHSGFGRNGKAPKVVTKRDLRRR
jgi:hypothetical protein